MILIIITITITITIIVVTIIIDHYKSYFFPLLLFLRYFCYDQFGYHRYHCNQELHLTSMRLESAYLGGPQILLTIFMIAPVEPHVLWVHDPETTHILKHVKEVFEILKIS